MLQTYCRCAKKIFIVGKKDIFNKFRLKLLEILVFVLNMSKQILSHFMMNLFFVVVDTLYMKIFEDQKILFRKFACFVS